MFYVKILIFFPHPTSRILVPALVRAQPVSAFSFPFFPFALCHHSLLLLATPHATAPLLPLAARTPPPPWPHHAADHGRHSLLPSSRSSGGTMPRISTHRHATRSTTLPPRGGCPCRPPAPPPFHQPPLRCASPLQLRAHQLISYRPSLSGVRLC